MTVMGSGAGAESVAAAVWQRVRQVTVMSNLPSQAVGRPAIGCSYE
jgi:hypothetical protein